jgi:hypothetical protein
MSVDFSILMKRLPYVQKCLSWLPGLNRALRCHFHGMRIVAPSGSQATKESPITVSGICAIKPDGDWILLTQRDGEFWPQGTVQIDHVGNTWHGTAWVNMDNPEPSTVLLAKIDPSIRYLVDYYWRVAKSTGKYIGIQMPRTPEGIKIVDRVVVPKGRGIEQKEPRLTADETRAQ